ncbi:response regulator transcription factor, partial [bacterium]|nr:response regulator transcription factor [bacterium]
STHYARQLLAEVEREERKQAQSPDAAMVESLSERELEVLRMLETSMDSNEIAGKLFIAVSTVRTHIKKIYAKLGVSRRMEAIQRARELGLL